MDIYTCCGWEQTHRPHFEQWYMEHSARMMKYIILEEILLDGRWWCFSSLSRPFPLLRKAAISYLYTLVSQELKKFLRGTPRPSTQCDKIYRGKKTGAEFVLSSQTANYGLLIILIVLASNCSHTPTSSMKARTTRFLSITGVPSAEMAYSNHSINIC